jgi:hypothetical protein
MWNFEVNWTAFAKWVRHMNMAFILGATRKKILNFCFMTISIMPNFFESWKLFHNMLPAWQMSYFKKIGFCWANLYEVHHPQSWRVTSCHFWKIFLFLMEQATCALIWKKMMDGRPPATNYQGEVDTDHGPQSGTPGQPPQNKSKILRSQSKIVACSAQLPKIKLPLHSWRPLVHITHIGYTSSSRSKILYICVCACVCVCAFPLSK